MGKNPLKIWLGCGCAVLLGLGIAFTAGLGYLASHNTRLLGDPATTRTEALEIMGAREIPDGYAAEAAIEFPFLADVVVLQGKGAQFVYLGRLQGEAELHSAFDSAESFDLQMEKAGLRIRRGQSILTRGSFRQDPLEARFALYDGPLEFDVTTSPIFDFDFGELVAGEGDVDPRLSVATVVRCQAGGTPALGLWAGPGEGAMEGADPAPGEEKLTVEIEAFRVFISRFGFCDAR